MHDIHFTYNLSLDPWKDLPDVVQEGRITRVGVLPDATEGGHPVIAFVTTLSSGEDVVGQVSWNQFNQLHDAIKSAPAIVLDSM